MLACWRGAVFSEPVRKARSRSVRMRAGPQDRTDRGGRLRKPRRHAEPKSNRAGEDIAIGRQRRQIGPVQPGKQIGAAGAMAAHQAHVHRVQAPPERHVQRRQSDEPMVAPPRPGAGGASATATSSVVRPERQPRPWRSPSGLNRWRRDGSLTRFARPGWQDGGAIMRRHPGTGPVQTGTQPAGLEHRRFQMGIIYLTPDCG